MAVVPTDHAPTFPVRLQVGTSEPIDLGELTAPVTVHAEVVDGQPHARLLLDNSGVLAALADLLEKAAADLRQPGVLDDEEPGTDAR